MKNVTVTLDEETARWARLEAARRDMSVSSLLRLILRDRMGSEVSYDGARSRYLARPGSNISSGERYPARKELHDRRGFR